MARRSSPRPKDCSTNSACSEDQAPARAGDRRIVRTDAPWPLEVHSGVLVHLNGDDRELSRPPAETRGRGGGSGRGR